MISAFGALFSLLSRVPYVYSIRHCTVLSVHRTIITAYYDKHCVRVQQQGDLLLAQRSFETHSARLPATLKALSVSVCALGNTLLLSSSPLFRCHDVQARSGPPVDQRQCGGRGRDGAAAGGRAMERSGSIKAQAESDCQSKTEDGRRQHHSRRRYNSGQSHSHSAATLRADVLSCAYMLTV